MDSSKKIKSVQLEETKQARSHYVCDEKVRLLRVNKKRIRERWVRLFRSLWNSKSDMTDPDISKRLPQQPVMSALGTKSTKDEIATSMKTIANAEAVGADGLPVKLLKLGLLRQARTILLELHRLQKGRQDGVRELPRHLARVPRGWLPGDLVDTVRPRDYYRKSSAGFDRIARPPTKCLWWMGCRKLGEIQVYLLSCASLASRRRMTPSNAPSWGSYSLASEYHRRY